LLCHFGDRAGIRAYADIIHLDDKIASQKVKPFSNCFGRGKVYRDSGLIVALQFVPKENETVEKVGRIDEIVSPLVGVNAKLNFCDLAPLSIRSHFHGS
jgi:hypothetical protein